MKIKTKTLSSFLKKTKMESTQQIDECILSFEKDGLKVNANSPSKQTRVMSWLKKEVFKDYEEFGNICINDLPNLIKALDRFGELVSLKKTGNLLTIAGEGKKVDIELVSEDFLNTDTGEPKLEFDEVFTISMSKMNDIFKDVLMNKDALLSIETLDKKVRFTNTGKYKFQNDIEALTSKGGTKAKFGDPLINAMSNLDGNIEISIKTDYPAKVMEKTETSIVSIIIAPRVDEE